MTSFNHGFLQKSTFVTKLLFLALTLFLNSSPVFAARPAVGDVFIDPRCGTYVVFDVRGAGCWCEVINETHPFETLYYFPADPSWPCLQNTYVPDYNELPYETGNPNDACHVAGRTGRCYNHYDISMKNSICVNEIAVKTEECGGENLISNWDDDLCKGDCKAKEDANYGPPCEQENQCCE